MTEDLSILAFTLAMAAASTAIILPLGVGAALLVARWRGPGVELLETALVLPLVLPPTAVGLLLLELFGRAGPLGGALHELGIEVAFTWKGVVLACAVMSFPLLVRSARTALEEIDPRLAGVARTLGHGRASVFFRVTLPLAWRGILAGALLAFSRAVGEFGATILVAGNIPGRTQTAALAIFQRAQLGKEPEALRLVALTSALAFVAVWATEWITRARAKRLRA